MRTPTLDTDDSEQSFFEQLLSDSEPEAVEFDEWVEKFHERVRDRTESLRE